MKSRVSTNHFVFLSERNRFKCYEPGNALFNSCLETPKIIFHVTNGISTAFLLYTLLTKVPHIVTTSENMDISSLVTKNLLVLVLSLLVEHSSLHTNLQTIHCRLKFTIAKGLLPSNNKQTMTTTKNDNDKIFKTLRVIYLLCVKFMKEWNNYLRYLRRM